MEEKAINVTSWSLIYWSILNVAVVLFFVYLIYLLFKFLKKHNKKVVNQ